MELETTTNAERLSRPGVAALDEILGEKFPVLDDGFIRVVDYMGDDAAVVQAARVSYGAGTRKLNEDRGLIRYLMRHSHTTPFEMCEIKFHVRVPMDCWRQWIRHRTANVNEYSTRYSLAIDAAQKTGPQDWRLQSEQNKQGAGGALSPEMGGALSDEEAALQAQARAVYQKRIEAGVAREQARKDLPLSTYTEAYWKIDLHNLLNFLALRIDPHAQAEIRAYAERIGRDVVQRWTPLVWEAFEDYRLNAVHFSAHENRLLAFLLGGNNESALALARTLGWLNTDFQPLKNRERGEFERKIVAWNLTAPWILA